jgi:hypothetical protein
LESLYFGGKFGVNFGRAAFEECSAVWNSGTNLTFEIIDYRFN